MLHYSVSPKIWFGTSLSFLVNPVLEIKLVLTQKHSTNQIAASWRWTSMAAVDALFKNFNYNIDDQRADIGVYISHRYFKQKLEELW